MADTTILNGDIGVTWFDNNRCKYLEWIGGTNDSYTMNELYSAMQTLQDETTTIDDGTCFSAETPTEYTIGKIDQGDNDPWYITFDLMEHITGGALKTAGWTRVQDVNTGIICVQVDSGGAIVAGDAGYNIVHDDGDSGTLLEFIDTGGAVDYCIIRPDSDAIANSFDAASSDQLTCNAHVADVLETDGVATTGEQIWANIYSLGTIDPEVHLYIYQGKALTTDARVRVFSWNSSTLDWYANGHIDTTVALMDITQSTWAIIDDGYLNVFGRKGGDLYASFEVSNSATSGGRNPVPLQTALDLDQGYGGGGHGTKKISFTGAVGGGPFTDGEVIEGGTSGGRGILDLSNSTVTASGELVYWPIAGDANDSPVIGGELVAMQSGETITGASSSASVTTDGAPADDGPADSAWFTNPGNPPTIVFANALADIDNDSTNEYYGVTIDCNQNPLTEVYQWAKYVTQYGRGAGGVIVTAEPGVNGEEYIGGTAYIGYDTISGTISEGESVTQATTGAKGVIISHDATNKKVLLRSTRGSFEDGYQVDADDDADYFAAGSLVTGNFAAKTAAPLGTFAGGTFFGARGVLITDYLGADENSFILTDIEGGTYERPATIVLEIINLIGGAETSAEHDRVSMFRLTGSGGDVDKTEYDITGTPAAGDPTIVVSTAITDDTPGKTAGGSLVIIKDPGSATAEEFKVRFSSWDTSTFTLANMAQFTTTGTTTPTQVTYATGGFTANVKRGDLVYNYDRTAVGYVKTVDSDTQLTLEGAGIPSQTTGDDVEINCVPTSLDSGDDVYVPFIDKIAAGSEESASIIYVAQIYYRVKVRNTRNTTEKIKPFSSDGDTSGSDVSVQVVRSPDTIITYGE